MSMISLPYRSISISGCSCSRAYGAGMPSFIAHALVLGLLVGPVPLILPDLPVTLVARTLYCLTRRWSIPSTSPRCQRLLACSPPKGSVMLWCRRWLSWLSGARSESAKGGERSRGFGGGGWSGRRGRACDGALNVIMLNQAVRGRGRDITEGSFGSGAQAVKCA